VLDYPYLLLCPFFGDGGIRSLFFVFFFFFLLPGIPNSRIRFFKRFLRRSSFLSFLMQGKRF